MTYFFLYTKENTSEPVSRVLLKATIYLRRTLPRVFSAQPERRSGRTYSVPICVCFGWGLPSHAVASMLVRSYHTVSAFPVLMRYVRF